MQAVCEADGSVDGRIIGLGAARRSRRVVLLLIGVVLLSLADLAITLTHLRTLGMVEANPVAAFLIRTTQSPWVLAMYKCLTVGLCVAVLYRLRRHVESEIAAWCAVLILAWLSMLWHDYTLAMDSPIQLTTVQAQPSGGVWLRLD